MTTPEERKLVPPAPDIQGQDGSRIPFLFDANEIMASPQFMPSVGGAEYTSITCIGGMAELLEGIGKTHPACAAARAEWQEAFDCCTEAFGRVPNHPLMRMIEAKLSVAQGAFDEAQQRLDDALTKEMMCIVAEALSLVGVTDPATIFEAARCSIMGGDMWDGQGYTPGETPVSVEPKPEKGT